jgi:hypothetical protein
VVAWQVAGVIVYLLQQQALRINSDPLRSPVAQRIRASAFYPDFLIHRVQDYNASKGWPNAPTPALNVLVEADGKPPQPVFRRRADLHGHGHERRGGRRSGGRGLGGGYADRIFAPQGITGRAREGGCLSLEKPSRWEHLRSVALTCGERVRAAVGLVIVTWVMLGLGYTLGLATGVVPKPLRNEVLLRICMVVAVVQMSLLLLRGRGVTFLRAA